MKAVMLVHTLGHPGQLEPLEQLCRTYSLRLVIDGAAALGTLDRGKPLGANEHTTAVSFNGNKIATTGGGGALLTNDHEVARAARHLATTAKQPHAWRFDHDRIGYNYRMPAVNAALGLAQLERLPQLVSRKRQLAAAYAAAFRDFAAARMLAEPVGAASNYWLNAIVLDERIAARRDALLARLHDEGILARPLWTPLPQQRMYHGHPGMPTPVADNLAQRVVCLPSSAILGGPLDE